jgi:acyl carrier protein
MTTSRASWTSAEIAQKVRELAAELGDCPVEQVKPETRFIEDLNYDSLTEIELVMKLEDAFDISLPDHELEARNAMPKSVVEFTSLVEAKLKEP